MSILAHSAVSTTATAAALGRFHTTKGDSFGRQRSSSFNKSSPYLPPAAGTGAGVGKSSLATADSLSRDPGSHRDLSAPLSAPPSQSDSESSSPSSSSKAQSQFVIDNLDRNNYAQASYNNNSHNINNSMSRQSRLSLPSPTDINSDAQGDQAQTNAPMICTGRSRSNTLTNTGTAPAEVAAAAINTQFDHIMRPRRPSLVNRPTGSISHVSPPFTQQDINNNNNNNMNNTVGPAAPSRHFYPPTSVLPQYHDVPTTDSDNDNLETANGTSTGPWASYQLGFLPRILVLIGLFGMSLGGLYLLAQVLPPLSLPKSIDDVKVDAEILEDFATATYEGWIRTFWVFSVVYMWKQCFGIPGSAFLNILAGALYGPWFGTVLTSLLTTLGSVLAYFMSFFLMEPIMNRYASTRLDQMRTQIQKKTSRSSGKSSKTTSTTSTATSTSSSLSTSASAVSAGPTTSSRGTLRTRSSSFTIRKTDGTDQDMSSIYSYPHQLAAANVLSSTAVTPNHRDDIEIHESEGLLSEENNIEKVSTNNNDDRLLDMDGFSKEVEGSEDDQDDEEGTSLFMQLLLIRLFPLTPYWFINLASPLVGVPVIPFMTSMFLGCMPYNYICAQAGAILGEINELRDIYQQPWIMFQIVMVLVLSSVAVWLSKRTKKQQIEKEQGAKSRSSEEEIGEDDGDESTHSLLRQHRFVVSDHTNNNNNRQDEELDTIEESVPMSVLGPYDRVPSRNSKRDSAVIDMSAYQH
ncbi:Transmembrane protein 41A [Linnemannia hyalina]|uniref:Transmembrane protein 41A n=1 Tax=Linnemannia hyalina TaxID=64524 RepID=A0A9P8BTX5_9FUNG|nr:Transmembrane protein 41A [Linnemannia hyalina]